MLSGCEMEELRRQLREERAKSKQLWIELENLQEQVDNYKSLLKEK